MLKRLRAFCRAHLAGQAEQLAVLREQGAELAVLRAEVARLIAVSAAAQQDPTTRSAPRPDTALLALQHYVAGLVAADGRHADPLSLPRHHAQVYSQNGEDGIIAEIFRRIGARDRFFVEIGIEGGTQNNTRLLLEQGWSGVWVEGNPDFAALAAERMRDAVAEGRLRVVSAMATPDGIDALLDGAGVPAAIDFLSLDIDQHTTHVWRALARRARVSCIEYNASVPASAALEVPWDPAASWAGTNWYGAGLKAIEAIGEAKGLHLVGCDALGVNAFLVDAAETGGRFRAPFTAETHYQPPLFGLVAHLGHASPETMRRWVAT